MPVKERINYRQQAEAVWKLARLDIIKAIRPKPRDSEVEALLAALLAAAATLEDLSLRNAE